LGEKSTGKITRGGTEMMLNAGPKSLLRRKKAWGGKTYKNLEGEVRGGPQGGEA